MSKHYTNEGKPNIKKNDAMKSLRKHLKVKKKKKKQKSANHLLGLIERKLAQWHDDEYDAGKDW